MGKRIRLKWAKDDNSLFHNFGDDLVPYLVKKLSDCEIEYVQFAYSRQKILKIFLVNLYKGKLTMKLFTAMIKSFLVQNYIIAIGSILQWYSSSRCIVWGAGIISKDSPVKKSKFLAVRGKYTQLRLKELGFTPPNIVGDPALLLPLVYKPKVEKKYRLGVIPHIIHYELFNDVSEQDDVLIIDLNTDEIENVVNDISSCEHVISSSLHGIIVSQAYDVKALWIDVKSKPLAGDNIKFSDYFSSVGIEEYEPYSFNTKSFDSSELLKLFENTESKSQIQVDLNELQDKLIEVAPFPVKKNIQEIRGNEKNSVVV